MKKIKDFIQGLAMGLLTFIIVALSLTLCSKSEAGGWSTMGGFLVGISAPTVAAYLHNRNKNCKTVEDKKVSIKRVSTLDCDKGAHKCFNQIRTENIIIKTKCVSMRGHKYKNKE